MKAPARREQLIQALDQNKTMGTDQQQGANDKTKRKAREVTQKMTGEERDHAEDEEDREQKQTEKIKEEKENKRSEEEVTRAFQPSGDEHEDTSMKGRPEQEAEPENIQKPEESQKTEASRGEEERLDDNSEVAPQAGDASEENETEQDAVPSSTEVKKDTPTDEKPVQVQVEPALIAQSAEDVPEDAAPVASTQELEPQLTARPTEKEPSGPLSPPAFPEPPLDEPAPAQPTATTAETSSTATAKASPASTPIDPTFFKSFPDVPDEDKPRVEVHVSQSPHNTPSKSQNSHSGSEGLDTPLAKIPGKSQSLSHQNLSLHLRDEGSPQVSPEEKRRESLEVGGTPPASSSDGAKLKRRVSGRPSPKSPLLDDEDPGDFEPGEGWAIVTK